MPSSTLSDALNEYAAQGRPRQSETTTHSVPSQQGQALSLVNQQFQEYTPRPAHNEVELAISESRPPQPRKASAPGVHAVQELLRIVCATREAQEIERKRRLAWEQEQEAKFVQRQAEMERQMFEMRQEISSLKAQVKTGPSTASVPSPNTSNSAAQPRLLLQTPFHYDLSLSSPMQLNSNPTVISSQELPSQLSIKQIEPHNNRGPITPPDDTLYSITPSPSPQLQAAADARKGHALTTDRRKRYTPAHTEDDGAESSGSESSSSSVNRPAKRANHHDTRCLTIHHAMRLHFVRMMGLESDKHLPDSHTEGTPLESSDPVRFVWEKTTKQSVHNGRMKTRVIADLKANRKLYKHVPDKDFSKKVLDSVFDQCFTTFRQKFKAQRDASAAAIAKKREDAKAQKARRLARRKAKLNARAEARMKHVAFEHVIFDGAFQLECMSSEESDFDNDLPREHHQSSSLLRTRGYTWRSTRLQRLYEILDQEDRDMSAARPRRGMGKKDRIVGPPKDGLILPPTGSASWMISKRWITATLVLHPDVLDVLKKSVIDPPGFDWDRFHELGEDSDPEYEEIQPPIHAQDMDHQVVHTQSNPYYTSSSSLQYALV